MKKLELCTTPSDKLACVRDVLAESRAEALQSTNVELTKQEQVLVTAYVLLNSECSCPAAEIMLLKDWAAADALNVFVEAINLLVAL